MSSLVNELILQERQRQESSINLIASENYASPAVMAALGSTLTNKYAEGYPGKRYYAGCAIVDKIETYGNDLARRLFNAEHANLQPHSGSSANFAAYLAVLKPGDTVLGMNINAGGHLTHGHKLNFSGQVFNIAQYGVSPETELLDYDAIALLADQHQPKMIIAGASAYARTIDYDALSAIARRHKALLLVDMAHIAGLIAAGLHPNPTAVADIVTSTTHKTLRGPRGGMILCRGDLAASVDRAVFPGTQGGPLMHVVAAKAIALEEALEETFTAYQQQVVANARAMARAFITRGYRIVTGGTDTHLLSVDLRSKNAPGALEKITGNVVEKALEACDIVVNRNLIPFDPEKPLVTSGIRVGTPAITTRGMKEKEVEVIAELIDAAIVARHDTTRLAAIKKEVNSLCKQFPIYP